MRVCRLALTAAAALSPALGTRADTVLDARALDPRAAAAEPPLQILIPANSLAGMTSGQSTSGAPPVPAVNTSAEPPPGPPGQAIGSTAVDISRTDANNKTVYLSVPVTGSFLGLSFEMNQLDHVFGRDPDKINTAFLGYTASIASRAREKINIRIGGSSQDQAFFNTTPSGFTSASANQISPGAAIHGAQQSGKSNVGVPSSIITRANKTVTFDDMLFMTMRNVSNGVPVQYWWGLNFMNNTEKTVGPQLKALQSFVGDAVQYISVGNAPDRYAESGARDPTYDVAEYSHEFATFTNDLVVPNWPNKRSIVAPNAYSSWDYSNFTGNQGFLQTYSDRMAVFGTERYPQSGCNNDNYTAQGHGFYLYHPNTVKYASALHLGRQVIVDSGLPVVMTETNSASCEGVASVSDTFTGALWGVDAAMELAVYNYSGAFYHSKFGTAPANVFSQVSVKSAGGSGTDHYFSTGPLMYSMLVVAEAFAPSVEGAQSRVQDLNIARADASGYAIYEGDTLQRVVLANMINDPSGANTWSAHVPVDPHQGNVTYKILTAPSVQSNENITWAGQTFGYWSIGTLQGTEELKTAKCNNGQCTVSVPAPGVALVFVTDQAAKWAAVSEQSSNLVPTGGVNVTALRSSNGGRGSRMGSTSNGTSASIQRLSENAAMGRRIPSSSIWALTTLILPASLLLL